MATPSPESPSELAEVEFGVFEYVALLWRFKWIFVAVAVVTTTVAAVHTRRQPNLYEATCTLIFTTSAAEGGEKSGAPSRTGLEPFSQNWALYNDVARTNEVMLDIIREFGLDQPPHNLSPGGLRSAIRLEAAGGDRLVRVVFRYHDPELAYRVVNYMGQALVNLSRKVQENQLEMMKTSLEADLKVVTEKMNEVARKLETVRRGADLFLLKAEMERKRLLVTEAGGKVEDLRRQIAEAEARLDATRHTLVAESPFLESGKSPVAPAPEPAPPGGGRNGSVSEEWVRPLNRPDVVNPAYSGALEERFNLEKDLAGLRTRLRMLTEGKDEGMKSLRQLEPEVGRLERDLSLLETQYEVLSTSYKALAKKLEETRLLASSTALPDLMMLDPALPPRGPVGPDLRRNVVTANLFTFALAAFGVILYRVIIRRRAKNAAV